jgi:hypothetical protein
MILGIIEIAINYRAKFKIKTKRAKGNFLFAFGSFDPFNRYFELT